MSVSTSVRSDDPFAVADRLRVRQYRQALLAEQAGNSELAAQLLARIGVSTRIEGVDYVDLPIGDTMDEVWLSLGFTQASAGWWEVDGIYKRLAAAISSIKKRGFGNDEITFGPVDWRGFQEFTWESLGGYWNSRHWRVTGKLRYSRQKIQVTDTVIVVKGVKAEKEEGRIEWTAFRTEGNALNDVLSSRLLDVFMAVGARLLARRLAPLYENDIVLLGVLTDEERDSYHDLHPSPVAAFVVYNGEQRIVLWDDDCGSAWLEGDTRYFQSELVQIALSYYRQRN
jgi:hypothetical protein